MSSPSTTTFGALLRQLRRRAQMTPADLAAAVGYSVSFISSLEQNTRRPDVYTVLQHFVPALALQDEPHLTTHLLELAAATQGDLPPTAAFTVTRERRIVITVPNPESLTNLPTPPTPLIGRDQTVKMLCDRLLGHQGRLLTLVGPPGVGKTRLGLAVAAQLQAFHPDGVYFVPLASVSDPDLVASALVAGLGLIESNPKPPLQRLLAFLRQKEVLLLFDNFEQVITAAPLVAELLAGCPHLRILVTSRERLHLRSEQRFLVLPLDLAPACTLFTQRAQAVDPAFTLMSQNQATVAEICRLLDCLPLAIELAAVQISLFTPQTLLARLHTQRLDSLNDGLRDLPDRHRSLRAVIDHSWRLLSVAEQRLLAQLSVFRGGFTPQTVEQVTVTPVSILLSLTAKSLVSRLIQENNIYEEERCTLHELIRHYAAERLTQLSETEENTHRQHSRFYCGLLARQEQRLRSAEQQAAISLITLEFDNIRVAWHWAVVQQQLDLLAQAMNGLGYFYEWRNHHQEGETVYREAVGQLRIVHNHSPLAQRLLADTLTWQSCFCRLAGHLTEARLCLQQSLTLVDEMIISTDVQFSKAFALLQQGHLEVAQTEYQAAEPYYRQALTLYQGLADHWGMAHAYFGLGTMYYLLCEYIQSCACYNACLAHYRTANDYRKSAETLERLAYIFRDQGLFTEAEQLTIESIRIYEMLDDHAQIAHGQLALGWLYIYTGQLAQAYAAVEKAVPVFEALGLTAWLTAPIVLLAIINMDLGRYTEARQQLESYLPRCRTAGDSSDLALSLLLLTAITIVEGNHHAAEPLLAESMAHYQKSGEQDRLSQAIAFRGFVAHGKGQHAVAQSYFVQALRVAHATQGLAPLVLALLGIALLLAEQGQVERAAELYAMIAENQMVANSQIRRDLVRPVIARLAATLSPDALAAAQVRGKAGDLWVTATALLRELQMQT